MVYVKNIVSDMRIYPGMYFLCKRIKVKDLQMKYRKHTSLKRPRSSIGSIDSHCIQSTERQPGNQP